MGRIALLVMVGCSVPSPSPSPSSTWSSTITPVLPTVASEPTAPLPVVGVVEPYQPVYDLTPILMAEPDPTACTGESTVFSDVSACTGLVATQQRLFGSDTWLSTGTAVADVDQDGWPDVLVTSQAGGNRLFFGSADGTFEDRTPSAISQFEAGPANFGDVDGDGFPDLFLGGKASSGGLFMNAGGVLQSPAATAPLTAGMSHGVAFSDFDADGLLEIYVTNWLCNTCYGEFRDGPTAATDQLWVQTSTGWEERAEEFFGLPMLSGFGFTSSWGDWDNDGDVDLYVANDKGTDGDGLPDDHVRRNVYFRNDGPGCAGTCFVEVAEENGTDFRIDSMGLASGDIDNDGDLDFGITDDGPPVVAVNDGVGNFEDQTLTLGILDSFFGWGAVFLDYDNDGFLDVYMASSEANFLWHNDGGTSFSKVASVTAGVAQDGLTLSAVSSDYDRDGRVDLIVGDLGGDYRVMRNTTETGNFWLGLLLEGSGAGGTNALGARVTVVDSSGRSQIREVKAGSSHGGGEDLGLHFGFGPHTPVAISVRWPDGTTHSVQPFQGAWATLRR